MANAMIRYTKRINEDGQIEFTTFRAWSSFTGHRSFPTLEEAKQWEPSHEGKIARIDKIVTTIVWIGNI